MSRQARIDIAIQNRQLLHQSIWCGLVFGLGSLLTILNLLPPIEVQYLVMGKVLTSPPRADILSTAAESPASVLPPMLTDVKVLDSSNLPHPLEKNSRSVLLGVKSLWKTRCNTEEFKNWIDQLTSSAIPTIANSDGNPEVRAVQWELDAARHYQNHHDYVVANQETQSTKVFQLASTGANNEPTLTQIKQRLDNNVRELESKLSQIIRNDQGPRLITSSSKVELTDDPQIQPSCRRIPGWMSISVLVLGCAAGASAGWLQLRLQSGGVFDPEDVARQLEKTGIQNVASVQLDGASKEEPDWLTVATQRASLAGRSGGRNMILVSEGILAIWCALIFARLCIDPLWRSLLLESPLAALGRLLAGMP